MKASLGYSLRMVAAGGCALALCAGVALAQSDVSVTLNGAPLNLNPPPQQRSGRVFVPLRGVFERLGASVVYDAGTINAQGNGHSISLRVGSTQATVDGQSQLLDVAPFIIGASTYVPLRFVSQALGAGVNYDAGNRVVALAGGNARSDGRRFAQNQQRSQDQQRAQDQRAYDDQRAQAQQQAQAQQVAQAQQLGQAQQLAQAQARAQEQARALAQQRAQDQARAAQPSALTFATVHPGRDESVPARRPTIEADFGAAQADPNSIRVTLDGLNVTNDASRSQRGVVYSPSSDLQSGRHDVRIAGVDTNGHAFDGTWTFASGTAAVTNSITDLRPAGGAEVRGDFTVSGHTLAGARVVVQVATVNQPSNDNRIGQLLGGSRNGTDSVRSEVTADASGNFQAPISIAARRGQGLTLVVDSTDAQTKTAAPRIVRNLTVE